MVTPRRYAAGRSRGPGVNKLPPSPLPIKLLPDRFAEPVRPALPCHQMKGCFDCSHGKISDGKQGVATPLQFTRSIKRMFSAAHSGSTDS
jgi:hypothetical protein